MKAKLIVDLVYGPSSNAPGDVAAVGTVLEFPDAWKLVHRGVAEPADEECRLRITRSPAEIEAAKAAYPRVDAGIHPDDYDAYDKGLMVGYHPDGSWIPGPNYETDYELADEDDEDDREQQADQ